MLFPAAAQAVEEAIARMEYELTHESLSAEREKQIREKKERAEKNDRPAAMRLAQVRRHGCCWPCRKCGLTGLVSGWSGCTAASTAQFKTTGCLCQHISCCLGGHSVLHLSLHHAGVCQDR
jgi:hypothetical protein